MNMCHFGLSVQWNKSWQFFRLIRFRVAQIQKKLLTQTHILLGQCFYFFFLFHWRKFLIEINMVLFCGNRAYHAQLQYTFTCILNVQMYSFSLTVALFLNIVLAILYSKQEYRSHFPLRRCEAYKIKIYCAICSNIARKIASTKHIYTNETH